MNKVPKIFPIVEIAEIFPETLPKVSIEVALILTANGETAPIKILGNRKSKDEAIRGLIFIPRSKSKIALLTGSWINGMIKIRIPDPKIITLRIFGLGILSANFPPK